MPSARCCTSYRAFRPCSTSMGRVQPLLSVRVQACDAEGNAVKAAVPRSKSATAQRREATRPWRLRAARCSGRVAALLSTPLQLLRGPLPAAPAIGGVNGMHLSAHRLFSSEGVATPRSCARRQADGVRESKMGGSRGTGAGLRRGRPAAGASRRVGAGVDLRLQQPGHRRTGARSPLSAGGRRHAMKSLHAGSSPQ